MKKCIYKIVAVVFAVVAFSMSVSAATDEPIAHHSVKHHVTHISHHHVKKTHTTKPRSSNKRLKTAQTHLVHLGYYKGKVDGVMGSKTKMALRKFQQHNNLKATGKLTQATYDALQEADSMVSGAPQALVAPVMPATSVIPNDFYTTHPDYYGYYHQQYANPMMLGTPVVPSRFAHVEVHEKQDSPVKSYEVLVNDHPLFDAANQPSVIGISRTFSMDHEDAVIFTAYRPQNNLCSYQNYLLVLSDNSQKLHEITNCTRGYQATLTNGSLLIVFPEEGSDRAVGSTWRYEAGHLEKL